MNDLRDFIKTVGEVPMSLVAARPGYHLPEVIAEIVLEYGINQNKRVAVYMDEGRTWFTEVVLREMLGIDGALVDSVLNPLSIYKKEVECEERDTIVRGIERLQKSEIFVESFKTYDEDFVDFVLKRESENSEISKIIIIYRFDFLLRNGVYSPREILEKLSVLTKKGGHIVFVGRVERAAEEKTRQSFENIFYYNEMKKYVERTALIHDRKDDIETSTMTVTTDEGEFEIVYDNEMRKLRW